MLRQRYGEVVTRLFNFSSGPYIVPVCASPKHRHYSRNRRNPAYGHCWLFPSVPSGFTGTTEGNRYYPTGTIEVSTVHDGETVR